MLPTCKLWNLIVMGGLEQTSPTNAIFFSIINVKMCWRIISTQCLKNWMQKDKDKWPLDCLSWKRWPHSLMKRFILCLGVLCTSMTIGIKWCPSILVDLSNGTQFHSYTCWLTNNTQSHRHLLWVNNHHIDNEDMVFKSCKYWFIMKFLIKGCTTTLSIQRAHFL
jgi:hypothetical protein